MSQDPVESAANARARELFERASAGIDARTAAQLQRMRREAVHPRISAGTRRWFPAAAAAVLVVTLAVSSWHAATGPGPAPPSVAATSGNPDEIARLLEDEDPDLYAWLADAPVATSTGATP